jgi:hypothetical protein
MKVFRIVIVIALLTGPAYAQKLLHSFDPEKTPQQKIDDDLKEKFSKEPQKRPQADANMTIIPRGDAPKSAASKTANSKTSNSKTATSIKQPIKSGTD